jgi:hypothetical protein
MSLSTFLNGRTAVQLRGLAWLALSDSGNVLSATVTGDSGGGGTTTWTAGGTVPCRLDPLIRHGSSRETAGAINERSSHIVTLPAGTDVAVENRFAIVGRGTFEVTAVRERTASLTQVIEVVEAF